LLISNVIRYNAVDIPTKQTAFSQYDRPRSVARYAVIARHLGLGGSRDHERVERLIGWVDEMKRTLEIPASIQAAGVPEAAFLERVDHIAEAAFDDQCTSANPRYPLVAEIRQLLLDSYYGRTYAEPYEREDRHTAMTAPEGRPSDGRAPEGRAPDRRAAE
ncbi:MAG TPA: iron-containing alcohol dehydrogenase, partial [Rhodopila sp.]